MIVELKRFFNLHIYTEKHIRQFVEKGVITAEQYEEITGEPYEVN